MNTHTKKFETGNLQHNCITRHRKVNFGAEEKKRSMEIQEAMKKTRKDKFQEKN